MVNENVHTKTSRWLYKSYLESAEREDKFADEIMDTSDSGTDRTIVSGLRRSANHWRNRASRLAEDFVD